MAGVREHTELEAWRLADAVRQAVWEMTQRPVFRDYVELRTQLRRAADSAGPNIAEGFARYHPRDFARFLRIARGSLSETIEHLTVAMQRGLVARTDGEAVIALARRSRGACTQLIRYLQSAKAPDGSRPHSRR